MNFTSFSFWWLFFLILIPVLAFRAVGKKNKLWPSYFDKLALALLSLSLFFNAAQKSFLIFAIELLLNYWSVNFLRTQKPKNAKLLAAIIITIDLGILIFYKYLNFFLGDILSPIIAPVGWIFSDYEIGEIPPGISFYTFQMIAFVVDSFKSQDVRNIALLDYVNFTAFFPQIVAGPIERRAKLLPQIQNFQFFWDSKNFDQGMRWLSLGMFMKLVLADNLATHIDLSESQNAWLICLFVFLFSFRIYFDFAGYSFIALGLAKIFGIDLSFNFLSPYSACNIQAFWRRWHVTLSEWFRDYLFIPLGGSRSDRTAFNIIVVFLVSGLWHGAGWNFICWGGYHGLMLVIHRKLGKYFPGVDFLRWLVTFISVTFGWLFFMETDLNRLSIKLKMIFSSKAYSITTLRDAMSMIDDKAGLLVILFGALSLLILEGLSLRVGTRKPYALLHSPVSGFFFLGGTLLLAARTASQFVYFSF